MNPRDRSKLQQAIKGQRTATVRYFAPLRGGVVTRHIRGYELSRNKAGRPVLWGSDSIHGARALHSFRLDRVVAVDLAERPTTFDKAKSITRDLIHEGAAAPPRAPKAIPRAQGRPPARRPAAAPYQPRAFITVEFVTPKGRRR